ncbi:amidohydrolase family protein [Streptomyces mirabilis]|uniref:hypothetical protein n=1 Tax=Streptomyces mirabilis TaxID=68239 RepID=UPI0036DC1CA6
MSAARAGAPLPEAVGLLRAVIVDGLLRDVALADGWIAAIGPTGSVPAGPGDTVDGAGRVLRPAFVEPHLHLDKALLGTPQGGGTLADAIAETARRKTAFTHDDVIAQADAVLHRAVSTAPSRSASCSFSRVPRARPARTAHLDVCAASGLHGDAGGWPPTKRSACASSALAPPACAGTGQCQSPRTVEIL